ncbi:MAG: hypothetical protein ACQEP5_09145 [Actinomycetota bacterium]
MDNFSGFENQDFTFFIDMPRDYKRVIKKKMAAYGESVYGMLNQQVKSSFKRNRMASIKDELPRAMYSIGKAYQDRTRFQLCGLAIILDRIKLSFSAVIRGGSFRDDKPVGMLYRKISRDPERFLELLSSYGNDYFLKIFKRVPAKGDKIRPGSEKWLPLSRFNLGLANFEMVEYILATLEQEKLPGLQLSYGIEAGHSLLQKPEELVKRGVRVIENEYGFLMYLEN